MRVILLSLLLNSIIGTTGFYLFDLFNIVDVRNVSGVTGVPGPKRGQLAYQFSKNTDEVSTSSIYFAYIADAIVRSEDYTFYTYYNFQAVTVQTNRKVYHTFIALQDKQKENPWFTIRFGYEASENINEGIVEVWKLKKVLFIERTFENYLIETKIQVDSFVRSGVWQLLLVRIKNDQFTVEIDCKLVKEGTLQGGRTKPFPFGGVLTLTQGIEKDVSSPNDFIPYGQFEGALYQPTILVGPDAFDYYKPCNTSGEEPSIPSEPRPQDVNRTSANKFTKLSSMNISPVRIFCTDSDGINHFSGTTWEKNGCWSYTCTNGEISVKYRCEYCVDPATTNKYMIQQYWLDPQDSCKQYNCRFDGIDPSDLSSSCSTLNCNKYGSQGNDKPKDQCCNKCWSDSCTDGREYYEGCDRPCSGGVNFQCPVKKRGCWCPEGFAINDDGQCIPAGGCPCKSGAKTYNAGQAVIRSACDTCVCTMGDLICFKSCIY